MCGWEPVVARNLLPPLCLFELLAVPMSGYVIKTESRLEILWVLRFCLFDQMFKYKWSILVLNDFENVFLLLGKVFSFWGVQKNEKLLKFSRNCFSRDAGEISESFVYNLGNFVVVLKFEIIIKN